MELTLGGSEPVSVGADKRSFLEDGDTITIKARAGSIELAPVVGTIHGN